ncbi:MULTISPECIES: hypothetical protein [Rhizobium]|uniref:hypothetical protein n=1 Tax=Rhizobium TaxID=379 RepID=UPI00156587FE|nr:MULTISPECIES: hypothetical protein [Rhizobium]
MEYRTARFDFATDKMQAGIPEPAQLAGEEEFGDLSRGGTVEIARVFESCLP